jgi:triphosphoribosyl-dephospho-CoA synthetase
MFTSRFLFIRRLSSSLIVWRHNQINPLTQISNTHSQELYKWNVAMTESNRRKTPKQTLNLFDKLITQHSDITPDFITYLLALTACIRLRNLYEGKRIHEYIQQRWSTIMERNKVQTCLIQLYATCGDLKTGK